MDKPHGGGLWGGAGLVDASPRNNLCYEREGEHFQGVHPPAASVTCANTLKAARAEKHDAAGAA